jgi:hypothetical protein
LKLKAKKSSLKKKPELKSSIQVMHDLLSFNEMKNILDLICLYHDINVKVIKNG